MKKNKLIISFVLVASIFCFIQTAQAWKPGRTPARKTTLKQIDDKGYKIKPASKPLSERKGRNEVTLTVEYFMSWGRTDYWQLYFNQPVENIYQSYFGGRIGAELVTQNGWGLRGFLGHQNNFYSSIGQAEIQKGYFQAGGMISKFFFKDFSKFWDPYATAGFQYINGYSREERGYFITGLGTRIRFKNQEHWSLRVEPVYVTNFDDSNWIQMNLGVNVHF